MKNNRRNYNNRRPFDREQSFEPRQNSNRRENPSRLERRTPQFERLRWVPPVLSTEPLPMPACPYCGRPIRDIAVAISDPDSGEAIHFDCIVAKIAEREPPAKGDVIAYIGGGRFGVVHFNSQRDKPLFTIIKILEWEKKDNRAEWRKSISDHYSLT